MFIIVVTTPDNISVPGIETFIVFEESLQTDIQQRQHCLADHVKLLM